MVRVRSMVVTDLPWAIDRGEEVHKKSGYAHLLYDKEYLCGFAWKAMSDPSFLLLLAEQETPGREPSPVGFFVGCVQPFYFGGGPQAVDLILYSVEDMRGLLAAKYLIKAFEKWALDQGAVVVDLGITTQINEERTGEFYQRLGYRRIGSFYRKEADNVRRTKQDTGYTGTSPSSCE